MKENNLVVNFVAKVNEVDAQVKSALKTADDIKKGVAEVEKSVTEITKTAKLEDFKKLTGWMRTGFKIYSVLERLKLIKVSLPDLLENWIGAGKQVVEVIKKGLDWWGFTELNTFDPLNKAKAEEHERKVKGVGIEFEIRKFSNY